MPRTAFTIPNAADAAFADQAEPDSMDFEMLSRGLQATGVVAGCAVTAQGSPDMTVAVASGTIQVLDSGVTAVTGANVTITAAHASLARHDLIVVNDAGTLSAVAGTPAANAVYPDIPADSVVLAAVTVPATDTAINSNQIIDKRHFAGFVPIGMDFAIATFAVDGQLSVATGQHRFYVHRSYVIVRVTSSVGTAPAGAAIRTDIHKAGTTIFTDQNNRPSIAIAGNMGTTTTIDSPTLVSGNYLTCDVDVIGSTTPGDDMVTTVWARHWV